MSNNGVQAQEAYERAYSALFGADTLAEATQLFGTRKASNIRRVAVNHPKLLHRYRNLVQRDHTYSRARSALAGASSLASARERYGASGASTLRSAVRGHPDLVALYDALPGAGQSSGTARANERSARAAEVRREALIEDVEMLLDAGESRDEIVRRVGKKSWFTLQRALERAGRHDLNARIQRK